MSDYKAKTVLEILFKAHGGMPDDGGTPDLLMERIVSLAYQKALADLAYEFDSHDFFRERDMVASFARTSVWTVDPATEALSVDVVDVETAP